MLILSRKTAPEACALPEGVTLWVRPAGQAEWDLATARVRRQIAKAEEGAEALARYGLPSEVLTACADFDVGLGLGQHGIAVELGLLTVERIDGATLTDGTPAPVAAETLSALFGEWAPSGGARATYGMLFLEWMHGRATLPRALGEPSPAAPDGAGAAGMSIVQDVPAPAGPAPEVCLTGTPESSAPTSSTRRTARTSPPVAPSPPGVSPEIQDSASAPGSPDSSPASI